MALDMTHGLTTVPIVPSTKIMACYPEGNVPKLIVLIMSPASGRVTE
jgi:hypothetical protein